MVPEFPSEWELHVEGLRSIGDTLPPDKRAVWDQIDLAGFGSLLNQGIKQVGSYEGYSHTGYILAHLAEDFRAGKLRATTPAELMAAAQTKISHAGADQREEAGKRARKEFSYSKKFPRPAPVVPDYPEAEALKIPKIERLRWQDDLGTTRCRICDTPLIPKWDKRDKLSRFHQIADKAFASTLKGWRRWFLDSQPQYDRKLFQDTYYQALSKLFPGYPRPLRRDTRDTEPSGAPRAYCGRCDWKWRQTAKIWESRLSRWQTNNRTPLWYPESAQTTGRSRHLGRDAALPELADELEKPVVELRQGTMDRTAPSQGYLFWWPKIRRVIREDPEGIQSLVAQARTFEWIPQFIRKDPDIFQAWLEGPEHYRRWVKTGSDYAELRRRLLARLGRELDLASYLKQCEWCGEDFEALARAAVLLSDLSETGSTRDCQTSLGRRLSPFPKRKVSAKARATTDFARTRSGFGVYINKRRCIGGGGQDSLTEGLRTKPKDSKTKRKGILICSRTTRSRPTSARGRSSVD